MSAVKWNRRSFSSQAFLLVSLLAFSIVGNFFTHFRSFADAGTIVDLSVSDAKVMIESGALLVLLDVRNQSEYDAGHIQHSRLFPVWQLQDRIDELDSSAKTLVYCSSGYRSRAACEILANNSFARVYNMIGGIGEWESKGYPVYMPYYSLQEAVNDAPEGSSLFIASGTYSDPLTVNKTLMLYGEDAENTIIKGNEMQVIVAITKSNVVFKGFTVQDGASGIRLCELANNCSVLNCRILNCSTGIFVETEYNLFSENAIANCRNSGIRTVPLCSCYLLKGNIVTGNTLLQNNYGLWLDYSLGCMVYHNNFIENTDHVFNLGSDTCWDNGYPSGGNYWNGNWTDLFSGADQNAAGGDGISDEPYTLGANNTDRYPFVARINAFPAGTWDNVSYRVQVESNSTVSDFHFDPKEGAFLTFNITSEDPTSRGFCRIAIPVRLLWVEDGWEIYLGTEPLNYANYSDENTTYLYVSYSQNAQTLKVLGTGIIPEFSSSIFAFLMFSLCVVAAIRISRICKSIPVPT